jgi:hypothetical protein
MPGIPAKAASRILGHATSVDLRRLDSEEVKCDRRNKSKNWKESTFDLRAFESSASVADVDEIPSGSLVAITTIAHTRAPSGRILRRSSRFHRPRDPCKGRITMHNSKRQRRPHLPR